MVQYTVRSIPKHVDKALRERARREGKSMNTLLNDIVADAVGEPSRPKIDLSDVAGTWVDDPDVDFDEVIRWQRRLFPEDWDGVRKKDET